MHTLHTRAAQIYQWWASESGDAPLSEEKNAHLGPSLWCRGWCPLLQGIARLCCDSRKQVRTTAITYLQRSLLVHDLQSLTAGEWESCFNTVLFPLLAKLLEPQRSTASTRAQMQADHSSWEETRIRAATLLSKVFLQHLGPLLQLPTFTALWLTLLDFMDKYMHVELNDLLAEAVPEMMKNLLLVMETAGVFGSTADLDQTNPPAAAAAPPTHQMKSQLWNMTCDRIDVFLPGLRQEITRSKTPVARIPPASLVAATEIEIPELVQEPSSLESEESPPESVEPNVCEIQDVVDIPELVSEKIAEPAVVSEDGALNFVPQSVFSVWDVPDPSDAAALFFHDLTPAPADENAISEPPVEEEEANSLDQLAVLPISLIPEDGSDIHVVPLPVFTAPAEDVQQNKVRLFCFFICEFLHDWLRISGSG